MDLIRRDQEQADRVAALQRYLDEAEASGTSSRSVKEIIAEARATARARPAGMTAYRLTEQADRKLSEIYLYAAEQFGMRQADKYVGGVQKASLAPTTASVLARIGRSTRSGT